LEDIEKDEVDELIIDLTIDLLNPTIKYLLNKEKIVNIVLDKQWKFEEGDANNTAEKLSKISITEGLNRLTKFISFFEQQES
ncbi:2777_t:CDS:2, partial [Racocetra fulgida]